MGHVMNSTAKIMKSRLLQELGPVCTLALNKLHCSFSVVHHNYVGTNILVGKKKLLKIVTNEEPLLGFEMNANRRNC